MLFRTSSRPRLLCFAALSMLGVVGYGCKRRAEVPGAELAALGDFPARGTGASFFEYFSPTAVQQVAVEQFERTQLSTRANLVSLNFTELARLTGNYGVAVRRDGEGQHQREDRWRIGTGFNLGTLATEALAAPIPIGINLQAGREVLYIRVYDDRVSALKALPKMPWDLPFNAERALAMDTGDFVSLPVDMGLTLGFSKGVDGGETRPFALVAGAGAFWQGEFRLNIYRHEGSRVRLKVAPSDSRGFYASADARARLNLFGYGVNGLVNLDRQAERLVGLDFFRLTGRHIVRGENLAMDYIFDLSDPDAQVAFNAIMSKPLSLKAGVLARQGIAGGIDADSVFGDLTPAEYLNAADDNRPPEQKRVTRVFRGARVFTGTQGNMTFGTRLLRWQDDSVLTFNWFNFTADGADLSRISSHNFSTQRRQSSWFSALRRSHELNAQALFAMDRNWERSRFETLTFDWQVDQSELNENERQDVRGAYQAILGDAFARLDIDIGLGEGAARRFRSRLFLALGPELLTQLRRTAEEDPETYEKKVWYALWKITSRFEGRYGPRTSGRLPTLSSQWRAFVNNSMQAIRNSMRSVIRLRWEGIHGRTVQDLVDATLAIQGADDLSYLGDLFKLIGKDESAQEIVPAYMLALADVFAVRPYLEVSVEARDAEPFLVQEGDNAQAALQTRVREAYYAVSHLGYEGVSSEK